MEIGVKGVKLGSTISSQMVLDDSKFIETQACGNAAAMAEGLVGLDHGCLQSPRVVVLDELLLCV